MALRFRCSKCGKRLTVNESPGTEVVCPYCNQGTAVPADAETVVGPAAALAAPAAALAAPAASQPAQPAPGQKAEKGKEEEAEEAEEQTSMDTVMGWLALYLPSWGTSVVLHAAVLILAAFFAWQSYAVQPPFEYKSAVVAQSQKKTVKRPRPENKMKDDETSRGKMVPRPSSLVRHMENPFPDVASNKMEVLEVIGVGGGGKDYGGLEGLGTGSGRGSGFFGAGGEARKIVYVVDRSGSMTDSIDYVKFELKRSIGELGEEKEFHVIFYSSGPPVEMPTRRLVNATDRNKQLAFEFVDGVIAQGETDPSKALERAFEVKPELIYLLTDGEFDKTIVGLVKKLNAGGQVNVHTIGFLYRNGELVLKQIAEENGGNYKFVSEKDLATLIQ